MVYVCFRPVGSVFQIWKLQKPQTQTAGWRKKKGDEDVLEGEEELQAHGLTEGSGSSNCPAPGTHSPPQLCSEVGSWAEAVQGEEGPGASAGLHQEVDEEDVFGHVAAGLDGQGPWQAACNVHWLGLGQEMGRMLGMGMDLGMSSGMGMRRHL